MAGKYVFVGGTSTDSISYLPPFTGGISESLSSKLSEFISVKDFGAVGDGVVDDAAALTAAFTQVGRAVYIPAGTYLYNSALPAPTCSAIFGEGQRVSTLKPGASVTKGLTFSNPTYPSILRDFCVDGSLTTGAAGIIFGETASVAMNPERLLVQKFTGAGACGFKIVSMLKSSLSMLTSYGNTDGLRIVNTLGDGNPTTLHFDSCVMTNSGRYGAYIGTANGVYFTNCDFESSVNEGVYVDTANGTDIIDLIFGPLCWFEQNNTSVGSTGYQVKITSNGGSRTVRPSFEKCFFQLGVTTPQGAQRAILFDGQDIRGYRTRDLRPNLDPGGVVVAVTNGAYGANDDWPLYVNKLTGLSVDATSLDFGLQGRNTAGVHRSIDGAPTIASAATIDIGRRDINFVSGTTTISTINTDSLFGTGQGGTFWLIPTGAWPWNTAGNIANSGTATANKPVQGYKDATTGKCYLLG